MAEYWHGGPRGLKGFILPADETGVPSTAKYGAAGVCRTDRVYITNNRTAAEMFGSFSPAKRVSVYLVEPIGEIEADPDCIEKNLSFQVAKAKIVKEFKITPSIRMQMLYALSER